MNIFKAILLFTFFATNAQTVKIIESETFEPISFATVKLYKDVTLVYGNYTNDKGQIDLNFDYNFIEVSCLGFETKKIQKTQLENNIFYLIKKNIELEAVTVSNKKKEFIEIAIKKERKSYAGFTMICKGYEITQFFENTLQKNTKIISFSFKTAKVNHKMAYRIRIYKKIKIGESNQDIEIPTTNTIYYLEEGSEGLVEVDLTEFDLDFALDGIYIGIEGLGENPNLKASNYASRESCVNILHYQNTKANTFEKYTFKNDVWIDLFALNKKLTKESFNINLKAVYQPYFVLKVEK